MEHFSREQPWSGFPLQSCLIQWMRFCVHLEINVIYWLQSKINNTTPSHPALPNPSIFDVTAKLVAWYFLFASVWGKYGVNVLCTQTFHFSWEKQNCVNRRNAELWILAVVALITFPLFHETVCACPGSLFSGSVNSLQSLSNTALHAPGAGHFLWDAEYGSSWDHLGHASKARELRATRLIHWLFGVYFPVWSKKSAAIALVFSHRVGNMKKHQHFGGVNLELGPLEVVPRADVTAVYLDSSKLQLGSSPVGRTPGSQLLHWLWGLWGWWQEEFLEALCPLPWSLTCSSLLLAWARS